MMQSLSPEDGQRSKLRRLLAEHNADGPYAVRNRALREELVRLIQAVRDRNDTTRFAPEYLDNIAGHAEALLRVIDEPLTDDARHD